MDGRENEEGKQKTENGGGSDRVRKRMEKSENGRDRKEVSCSLLER